MNKILLALGLVLSINGFSQTIDGGDQHVIFICDSGIVKSFGSNSLGQLGNTSISGGSNAPVPTTGLTLATLVSAGKFHSLAINNGDMYTWGVNFTGQIGDSTTGGVVNLPYLSLNGVKNAAAGGFHTLAVKNDGTVWAWGKNSAGQLGIGNNLDTNRPVQIVGLTNIIQVAAGSEFSLALDSSGNVYSWGNNQFGQLGIGSTMDANSPVMINALSDIIEIVAGSEHTLALDANGDVWAFGNNSAFQSSGNTSVSKDSVPIITSCGKVRIGAGSSFSYAVDSSGAAFSWGGNNTSGQLGDGSTGLYNAYPPTSVSIVSGKVNQIGSGPFYAYALTDDGIAHTWGGNSAGLGDGSTTSSPTSTVTVASVCDIKKWEKVINNVSCVTPMPTAFNGSLIPIPGKVQAEDYGNGGEGVAYHDNEAGLSPGAGAQTYRSEIDVELETTTDTDGGYNVGFINNGEWLKYVVDVKSTGTYEMQIRVASDGGGGAMRILFENQGIDETVTFPATGGWQTWTTISIPNLVFNTLGEDIMKVEFTDDQFNINYFEVTGANGIEADMLSSSSIYPNPFNTIFNLNSNENSQVTIMNVIGQELAYLSINKGLNKIDFSELNINESGIYLLKIEGKNNSEIIKVVKK